MVEYESKSFFRILFQMRGSVLPLLMPRILACAAMGGVAAYLFDARGLKIAAIGHTLVGVALGLLLVFRTNASYDRYWEGRKLLGGFVNRARDLVRQAAAYVEGDDDDAAAARRSIRRHAVLLYALLRQYLRKERDLGTLGVPISDEERAALADVAVRPCLAAYWLSEALMKSRKAGRISEEQLKLMDANVSGLLDMWGGTERIMRTPIPFAYAQHIKSFLTLFCFSVPFAMVEAMRWYTPIAAAIVAFGMFGIDEIGVEIEEPFGYDANDLPLDAIGNRIAEDTRAILAQRDPNHAEWPM